MTATFKHILFVALIGLILLSCRPEGVLSPSKMEDLLVELHYVEGVIQYSDFAYGHETAVHKYYQVILQEYGVTQQQFDSSLVWYTDHPQKFNKIYPRVLEREKQALTDWQEKIAAQSDENK